MSLKEKLMTLVKNRPATKTPSETEWRRSLIRSLIRRDREILDRLAQK